MNLFAEAIAWIFSGRPRQRGRSRPVPLRTASASTSVTFVSVAVAALIADAARLVLIGHTGEGARRSPSAISGCRARDSRRSACSFFLLLLPGCAAHDRSPRILCTFVLLAIPSILAGAYAGFEASRPQGHRRGPGDGHDPVADPAGGSRCRSGCSLLIGGLRAGDLQVDRHRRRSRRSSASAASASTSRPASRCVASTIVLGGALLVAALALVARRRLRPAPAGLYRPASARRNPTPGVRVRITPRSAGRRSPVAESRTTPRRGNSQHENHHTSARVAFAARHR